MKINIQIEIKMLVIKLLFWYYFLGCCVALLIIGAIHLYSYCFEEVYSSAQWENILQTVAICGFPFGIALWLFQNYRKFGK